MLDCPNQLRKVVFAGNEYDDMFPMESGEKPWTNQDSDITNYPKFLKGGFFVQKPYKWSSMGTNISIVVSGKAIIYVAIEKDPVEATTGGYEISLPKAGWKNEVGEIEVTRNAGASIKLGQIFSKTSRFNVEKTYVLPPITTSNTILLISTVPICSGKYIASI